MDSKAAQDPELRPLLQTTDRVLSDSDTFTDRDAIRRPFASPIDGGEIGAGDPQPSRSVEDVVLPEASPLGRTISWQSAYILAISRVVGSGIFATPGAITQSVGSIGLSLSLWVVGAVIAACGLSVALEYGCMLPRSGGTKVYLEFTYRWPRFLASTLYAIYAVMLGFTASNCVVFSRYVLFALGVHEPGNVSLKGLAIGLLTTVTVVHGIFPKTGVRIQNTLGWVKVGVILFMILSGIYVVLFRPDSDSMSERSNLLSWDHLWEDSSWNWGVIATSLFKVFYSYAGLDNVSNVLNEVKDPVRTLRSVAMTALATACSMYFLINVAYFLVVPVDEIRDSGELIAALFFEHLFGENLGRRILPLAVALSAAGNVMVVTFAMARIKQEIARQGFLPFSDLLSSSRPFNSPLGGFIVHYIPSFLVIALPPSGSVYSFILEVEGYAGELVSLAVAVGLLKLRFQRPDLKRPFKAWTPAVLVKITLAIALIAAPFFRPPEGSGNGLFYATYALVGVTIFLAGIVYWYVWTIAIPRWRGSRLEEETRVLQDGTVVTKLVYV
ncbi:amino acid permease-domain-containing protein [Ilyonectria sp. MPI-CAGE-AT-0026]|nr:amino acid permease-domain-containing protein [Ilyonectria sp. MPI-CAGE-AT-0026]